jgi:hypothetical protein
VPYYYDTVKFPGTVNVAIFSPPGAVDVVFVPGDTERVVVEGALIITIPPPPFPAALCPKSLG